MSTKTSSVCNNGFLFEVGILHMDSYICNLDSLVKSATKLMCMLCTGHLLKNAYDELTAILGWTNCKQILAKDELPEPKMSYLNQR